MAVTPVPKCIQVNFNMLADGQLVENTFYVQCTDEPTGSDIQTVLEAGIAQWITSFQPLLPLTCGLFEVVGVSLTGLGGARAIAQVNPPEDGSNVSTPAPLNATLALKRSGAMRGRGLSGRIYWPQLAEGQYEGDRVTDAFIADALVAVQALSDALAAAAPAGATAVIAHKTGAHAGTSTEIAAWSAADGYIDSQRNRLPRHKRHKKPSTP